MEALRPIYASTLQTVHRLFEQPGGLNEVAKSLNVSLTLPRDKVTILVVGNHSAGKSSFINYYIGETVQKESAAMETTGISIVTSGKRRETFKGNATLKLLPFLQGIEHADAGVLPYVDTQVVPSTGRDCALVDFIDTPGLADGQLQYPFDVHSVLAWLADRVNLVFVFFDPHGQATCERTMQLLRRIYPANRDKMHYFLAKADTLRTEQERLKVMSQLSQSLAQLATLPPASSSASSSSSADARRTPSASGGGSSSSSSSSSFSGAAPAPRRSVFAFGRSSTASSASASSSSASSSAPAPALSSSSAAASAGVARPLPLLPTPGGVAPAPSQPPSGSGGGLGAHALTVKAIYRPTRDHQVETAKASGGGVAVSDDTKDFNQLSEAVTLVHASLGAHVQHQCQLADATARALSAAITQRVQQNDVDRSCNRRAKVGELVTWTGVLVCPLGVLLYLAAVALALWGGRPDGEGGVPPAAAAGWQAAFAGVAVQLRAWQTLWSCLEKENPWLVMAAVCVVFLLLLGLCKVLRDQRKVLLSRDEVRVLLKHRAQLDHLLETPHGEIEKLWQSYLSDAV